MSGQNSDNDACPIVLPPQNSGTCRGCGHKIVGIDFNDFRRLAIAHNQICGKLQDYLREHGEQKEYADPAFFDAQTGERVA